MRLAAFAGPRPRAAHSSRKLARSRPARPPWLASSAAPTSSAVVPVPARRCAAAGRRAGRPRAHRPRPARAARGEAPPPRPPPSPDEPRRRRQRAEADRDGAAAPSRRLRSLPRRARSAAAPRPSRPAASGSSVTRAPVEREPGGADAEHVRDDHPAVLPARHQLQPRRLPGRVEVRVGRVVPLANDTLLERPPRRFVPHRVERRVVHDEDATPAEGPGIIAARPEHPAQFRPRAGSGRSSSRASVAPGSSIASTSSGSASAGSRRRRPPPTAPPPSAYPAAAHDARRGPAHADVAREARAAPRRSTPQRGAGRSSPAPPPRRWPARRRPRSPTPAAAPRVPAPLARRVRVAERRG